MTTPKVTADEANKLFRELFPQIADFDQAIVVEDLSAKHARVRMGYSDMHLRPGGTMSGPAMFTLADVSMYAVVFGALGLTAMAVTANMNINFLRKPAPADLISDCKLLKLGKRLAVSEVTIYSDGDDMPVAHATGSYAIPQS
ncbi:MAG: PaaI family thioesterase [Pseudomonadota bacterium]